ncbi:hypothetical protein M902_1247 [Bacteriovorax sp. BAL6_X]|uniref:hypothetical protein n=1 Tax=Bacteriovorax sp. BAL6_X TaxID=1201290 RepID=UPI0003861155|nr:hypothetical protein [Bacteriovorax sp. BAL6_X]EPZ50890.1 hypothetical protein M902_1247 [Bacteriovorax sp. BAL6_X]
MKYLIILLALFNLSQHSLASDESISTILNRKANKISIPNEKLEAVISKSGVYSRVIDIQEEIEKIRGVHSTPTNTIIDLNDLSNLDLRSLYLDNSQTIDVSTLRRLIDGGDMGGG